MLLILSPSKTLDSQTTDAGLPFTQPDFLEHSQKLVQALRQFSQDELAEFMEISDKLAALNLARFQQFHTPFTLKNARQALLSFKGDVYENMAVEHYSRQDFDYAQQHLRILSGLYGLLRPLDLIQPYRLEMGRKLLVGKTKDLYGFWQHHITQTLNAALATHKNKMLLNLASEEYAKALDHKHFSYPIIDIVFKEEQASGLKIIGLFAKQARGAMADYVIRNRIDQLKDVRDFSTGGYRFQPKLSTDSRMLFTRRKATPPNG